MPLQQLLVLLWNRDESRMELVAERGVCDSSAKEMGEQVEATGWP